MNPGELWPAAVLVVLPLAVGVCLGFMADAWVNMRQIRRAANRGDRLRR